MVFTHESGDRPAKPISPRIGFVQSSQPGLKKKFTIEIEPEKSSDTESEPSR